MRINIAIVISGITLMLGAILNKSYLWIPLSVLVAGLIDLFTRRWVVSDRLGSAVNISMFLKSFCSLAVLYAMVGEVICVGLIIWWFI